MVLLVSWSVGVYMSWRVQVPPLFWGGMRSHGMPNWVPRRDFLRQVPFGDLTGMMVNAEGNYPKKKSNFSG
jgi:hypothetical protein